MISSTTCTANPDRCSCAVASASVRLLTSGICEVPGPSETCSVITEPLPCWVPAAGLWPTTMPASASSSTFWRETAKPTPWRIDSALSNGLPTTFGTAIGFGPEETLTRTVVPTITSVPALGAVASTVLTGSSELTGTTFGSRPAAVSSATAWSRLRPTSVGTRTFDGPVETTIVTKLPRSIRSPACGSCSKTIPGLTPSSFGRRSTSSFRPASLICWTARRSTLPSTSGTATGLAASSWDSSSW